MNYTDRINYYLGKNLIEKKIDIKTENFSTINDYNTTIHPSNYANPLKELLIKTGNDKKKICCEFGDIENKKGPLNLVKNRCEDNEDSVILRCLDTSRHWGNYYSRPEDIPFEKKQNKIFWRGTTTGQEHMKGNRFDLVKKWFNKNENIDVGFSFICQGKDNFKQYVSGSVSEIEFLKYKYILSIRGNDKDSGLQWKLNSNSVILMPKPTITTWLMETTLIPDFHYVLLKDDFSDLAEKLNWCNKNQDKCKNIIKNANTFMNQFADNKKEEQLEVDVINKYFELIGGN